MLIKKDNWKLEKGILIRAYMPLGFYPKSVFSMPESSFVIGDDLIFSAVRFQELEIEDYYIEKEWLKQEEIRLLSALELAVPVEKGKVYAYPHPLCFKIEDKNYDLSNKNILDQIKNDLTLILQKQKNNFWQTVEPPPILGGPNYKYNENTQDLKRQINIFKAIDLKDHLLIRGLGALIKGHLLFIHHIFHTEACISMHIAMEATLQIILRHLRKTMQNPSNKDASLYLGKSFNSKYIPEKYFEEYYKDRILAVHPSNRIGTFPDAPLNSDDFLHLYDDLKSVYDFLITGNVHTIYDES
jgi:hypothetical protein